MNDRYVATSSAGGKQGFPYRVWDKFERKAVGRSYRSAVAAQKAARELNRQRWELYRGTDEIR